jgi:outer membrane lipoprotein SlyB
MRKITMLLALVAMLALSGCAQLPYQTGSIYTSHTAPMQATQNEVGNKKGEACQTNILGIFSTGDASIAAAAKAGGMGKVGTVNYSFSTILGLYSSTCTVVTGN